ncbi:PH domain-containing protein [Alkalicoccus chagannorensis]|uniref:PH domain-containing protein n=1 Tax=Alkalicoccus chagannorensis TaxID=427072 RepID=UPI000408033E|nr:PH domain-containing protein [Alkalicoccus chagannorensis]
MNSWQRQHPAAVFISFLSSLKQLLITLVVVFIFGQTSDGMPLFVMLGVFGLILLFALLNGFISWWRFMYYLQPEELQVKQGLIFRKNRFIRRDRVQSIDINANILQRLFGLVELRIETAGGGSEPEFRLIALKRETAEAIKGELLTRRKRENHVFGYAGEISEGMDHVVSRQDHAPAAKEPAETPISYSWELGIPRLLIAAVTSSGVGIAATFIAAVVSQAPQFLPDWILNLAVGWIVQSSIVYVGMFFVTVLLSAWVFTIISTTLKYGYFTVKKQGKDIHISRGVLEQRQLTIQSDRINAVRIVQNLLREPIGYCAVYVESAGGGTKDEDLSTILLPLVKRSQVQDVLKELAPQYALQPDYEGLPKESMRRYMIKLMIPTLLAAAVLTYAFSYGWISFLLPILGGLLGYVQYRTAGLTTIDEYLCLKSRAVSRSEVLLPRPRIQDMGFSQNPLQRLNELHTLYVSVLTTVIGKTFSLKHISRTQQERYMLWYSYQYSLGDENRMLDTTMHETGESEAEDAPQR